MIVLIGLGIVVVFFLLVTAFCFGMDKGESSAAKRFEFERQFLHSEKQTWMDISLSYSKRIQELESKYIRPHGEHGRFIRANESRAD